MSFGLSLDALAGSGVTDDGVTGPDEAVRAGGVTERLIHGTRSFPGCCCGLLHLHCSQQSADMSDPAKISFDFCFRSKKTILLYIFVSGFPPCFSQLLPSPFLAGHPPPQKIYS